ncbi:hypothetical protein [Lysinibacillus sphaericus]|uniref:hypothetical protein n=1 Tax=Lysinibacillus sphaericus TaxID=1421 RepID=UPI000C18FB6C|nr:hypothetical protein [Lysinibacillus sphaericus]PIJ98189.1 hypothetical protein CTN02_10635 [Lysinibacillus sphaericus]
MRNDEIYVEMLNVSNRINELYKQNNLKERNELVPKLRELYKMYDFGFSVREIVETIAWRNKWSEAKILEHRDDNYFLIRNDKGWEVYVPGTLIRKLESKESAAPTQLYLF